MITLDQLHNIASPTGPSHALLLHGRMIGCDRTAGELRSLKDKLARFGSERGLPWTVVTTQGWPAGDEDIVSCPVFVGCVLAVARDQEAPIEVATSVFSPRSATPELWTALSGFISHEEIDDVNDEQWDPEEDAFWLLPTGFCSALLSSGEVVPSDPEWESGTPWDGDIEGDPIAGVSSDEEPSFVRLDADAVEHGRTAPAHLLCRHI